MTEADSQPKGGAKASPDFIEPRKDSKRGRISSVGKTPLVSKESGNALIAKVDELLAKPELTVEDLRKDAFLLRFFLYRAGSSNDSNSFRYAKALLDCTYGAKAIPGGEGGELPEGISI